MKKFLKLAITFQLIAITLLASCAPGVNASANVCHATGDAAAPYEEITIDSTELLNEHRVHADDIFPVPAGGCPGAAVEVTDGNITICHATSSETNPYEEITVSVNGLNGHGDHEGDIIPMPEEGCSAITPIAVTSTIDPSTTTTPAVDVTGTVGTGTTEATGTDTVETEISICHATDDLLAPYEEILLTSDEELNEHADHPNDIYPAPATGCPDYLVLITDGQITFCHYTGDATTPYEEVIVSVDGLDGHGEHENDAFQISEEEGCPTTVVVPDSGKITICHATNSKKNPYVEITISVNGLNGHNKHANDIIPMPAGGCP